MRLIDLPALPMTAEEFGELPEIEGVRVELWEGNLLVTPAAQMAWHSMISHRVQSLFRAAKLETGRSLAVTVSPRDVPVPDVLVFREPIRDPHQSLFPAANLRCVVEVVSPESLDRDTKVKPAQYAAAGVPEFWLVREDPEDPFEAHVEIYRLTPASSYGLMHKWALADLERAGYDSRLGDSRLGA